MKDEDVKKVTLKDGVYTTYGKKKKIVSVVNIKGKRYIVQRLPSGRPILKIKYKAGGLKEAIKRYNSGDGSIREGTKVVLLKNVYERTDYGKPRRHIKMPYQYFVTLLFKKKTATARSFIHDAGYPKKAARDEAIENALCILLASAPGLSDGDYETGLYLMEKGRIVVVDEGITTYSRI